MKLKDHKVYILPTAPGTIFLSVTFTIFIIAMVFANPFGISFSFLLISMVLCSTVVTHLQIKDLQVAPISREIYCYDDTPVDIVFSTKEIDHTKISAIDWEAKSLPFSFSSQLRGDETLVIRFPSFDRGIYRINRLTFKTTYPFGLFKAWINWPIELELIIPPRPVGEMATPDLLEDKGNSTYTQKHSFHAEESYFEHRPYRMGDSWRRIDWRRYSRGHELSTKVFDTEVGKNHLLRLKDLLEKKVELEQALRLLSHWAVFCYKKNYSYQLELEQQALGEGQGEQHLKKAQRLLASYQRDKNE